MSENRVNKTQYAKLRGVSRVAVHNAINEGRISDAVGPDGKIDVELADRLWAANTNPTVGHHGAQLLKGKAPNVDDIEMLERAKAVGVNLDAIPDLATSKTLQAAFQAQLARLDYEERTERLVDQEKVKKEAFKLARLTRDAMLAIPDRVAAEIAGMTDAFAIHKKLMDEIRKAIAEITKVVEV